MQRYVVVLGPVRCDISSTQDTRVFSFANCVFLGKHHRGLKWLQGLFGSLMVPPGPVARIQDR